jgi:hypothetical protein
MLNTKTNIRPIREISLAKHKLWTIEGDRRGDVISCLNGTLWITQEGDLKDYVLEAGKNFWVTKPGAVVVQGLDNARFTYNLNEPDTYIAVNTQPVRRRPFARLSNHLR